MSFSNILFKTTGIMTSSCIKSKSIKIGQAVSEVVASDGNRKSEEINKILQEVLGSRSGRIRAVTDKQEFIELSMKNLNISEETSKEMYKEALSMVLPKGAGDAVILNIRSEILPLDHLASIAAHETEHALNAAFSVTSAIQNFIFSIPKFKEKFLTKALSDSDEYNKKLDLLQKILVGYIGKFGAGGASGAAKSENTIEGLLKQCKVKSLKDLRTEIRKLLYGSGILTIGQDKKNKYWLDSLIYNIKDEQRAYDIGGSTQRFYQELMGVELSETAAKSELCAKLYDEALQVLKKERKHIIKNILRSKLKLKPKYTSEQKLLQKAKIEYVFNKIIETATKSGKKVDVDSLWKNSKELLKQLQPIGKKAVSEGRQDFNDEEWQEILEITLKVLEG